jgi:hypothetical protein
MSLSPLYSGKYMFWVVSLVSLNSVKNFSCKIYFSENRTIIFKDERANIRKRLYFTVQYMPAVTLELVAFTQGFEWATTSSCSLANHEILSLYFEGRLVLQ